MLKNLLYGHIELLNCHWIYKIYFQMRNADKFEPCLAEQQAEPLSAAFIEPCLAE
jgi:hypothetical protein